jgi:hypothetical protein
MEYCVLKKELILILIHLTPIQKDSIPQIFNLQSSMNKAVSVEAYILSCLAAFFRRFDAMVYFAHRRF